MVEIDIIALIGYLCMIVIVGIVLFVLYLKYLALGKRCRMLNLYANRLEEVNAGLNKDRKRLLEMREELDTVELQTSATKLGGVTYEILSVFVTEKGKETDDFDEYYKERLQDGVFEASKSFIKYQKMENKYIATLKVIDSKGEHWF